MPNPTKPTRKPRAKPKSDSSFRRILESYRQAGPEDRSLIVDSVRCIAGRLTREQRDAFVSTLVNQGRLTSSQIEPFRTARVTDEAQQTNELEAGR